IAYALLLLCFLLILPRHATSTLFPTRRSSDLVTKSLRIFRRPPQIRASSFRPRPPEFTELALGGFGFRCVWATHPTNPASNPVRVPWPVRLPPASFRSRLAAGTLAFG